jgi:hypothetical protein
LRNTRSAKGGWSACCRNAARAIKTPEDQTDAASNITVRAFDFAHVTGNGDVNGDVNGDGSVNVNALMQRFQGLCFVSTEGWEHMDLFDQFPPEIRQRLRDSPFNLCAACVADAGLADGGNFDADLLMQAIENIEAYLR